MGSSPRDFGISYHPRYGEMAESQKGSSSPEMTGKQWGEGVGSNPTNRNRVSNPGGEGGHGGRLQLLPMSLQIIEGVVSVSIKIGAAASLGGTDPQGLQVRGSGWPGSGALAGGGGGGRIGLSRGTNMSRGPGQSRTLSAGRAGAGGPSKAQVGAGGEKLGGEGDGSVCSGSESSDGPGGPSSSSTSKDGKTPTWPPNSPLQKPSSTPS